MLGGKRVKPLSHPFMRYVVKRLAMAAVVFFVALLLIFTLPRLIPGNPLAALVQRITVQLQTDPELVKEVEKALTEQFKLNEPIHVQFIDFLSDVIRGDLGLSILFYPLPVSLLIATYLPWTILLVTPAITLAWIVGNLFGTWAALNRGKAVDRVGLTTLMFLNSIPPYVFGMYLVLIFGVFLKVLPVGGAWPPYTHPSLDPEFIVGYLRHYILPFFSIFLPSLGVWGLSMRNIAVQEQLYSSYSNPRRPKKVGI